MKTQIKFILFSAVAIFERQTVYIITVIFQVLVSDFPFSGATTSEWSPSRAFRRAASCFGVPEIISGAPKHNLPCSLEHEFFCRKIKIWRLIYSPLINSFRWHLYHSLNAKTGATGTLGRCNRMTYSATDRQQAAMIVAIRKIYRYFAACQHVFGSSIIQVCVRYMVYGCLKPSGNG